MNPQILIDAWRAKKDYKRIIEKRDILAAVAAEGKTLAPEDSAYITVTAAIEKQLPGMIDHLRKNCHKIVGSPAFARALDNSPPLHEAFCKLTGGLMERSAKLTLVQQFNRFYPEVRAREKNLKTEADIAAAAEKFSKDLAAAGELAKSMIVRKPLKLKA